MKKKTIVIIVIIAVVVASIIAGGIMYSKSGGLEVKTAQAVRGNLVVTVSATGTLRSVNEAKLTTAASGRVSRILIVENQKANKGDVLLELESAVQAEKDFKRLENLAAKGFVSSQQAELAREQWKNAFITAPFTGTIAKKFVEPGEPLMGGGPAFLLADLDNLLMETNIDETDIGEVIVGQAAEVVLDAYKNERQKGKVDFIARTSLEVKEKGITYTVKVKLESSTLALRLGMTGDVYIRTSEKKDCLMIPYPAIAEDADGRYVFAVEKGALTKKYIKTGLENYDSTEILSGLAENETVVASNATKYKEGMKVKPAVK